MSGEQKIVSYACITKDNKVLLLHRTEKFNAWEFPGGYFEFGEHPRHAAERETEEECGLIVKAGELIDVGSYISSRGNHQVPIVYNCEFLGGEAKVNDDSHSECGWFGYEELEKLNLSESVEFILPKLRKIIN